MYYYQKINRTIHFFKQNTNIFDNSIFKLNTLQSFFICFKLSINKLNIFLSNDLIFYIYEIIFNTFIYKDYFNINNKNSYINDKILYKYYNTNNIKLILLYFIKKIKFYDTFSFYKYSSIIKNYELFDLFIDIGYIYIGMGHLITFSKLKKKNLFFFRKDGGSNGFDILFNDNYMNHINFDKVEHYKLLNCKQIVTILCNCEIINNLNYYLV